MSSKKRYKELLTDEEIGLERVFEVMVRDIRKRGKKEKASFSLHVRRGAKDNEYENIDEMRDKIEKLMKKENSYYGNSYFLKMTISTITTINILLDRKR